MDSSDIDDIPLDVLEKHGFEYISILGSGGFGIVLKVRHNISQQGTRTSKIAARSLYAFALKRF